MPISDVGISVARRIRSMRTYVACFFFYLSIILPPLHLYISSSTTIIANSTARVDSESESTKMRPYFIALFAHWLIPASVCSSVTEYPAQELQAWDSISEPIERGFKFTDSDERRGFFAEMGALKTASVVVVAVGAVSLVSLN